VDSTTGGNFAVYQSNSGKRIFIKQRENYPKSGTAIMLE